MNLADKLRENISVTGENYFVDTSEVIVKDRAIENFKLTMLWLAAVQGDKNVLLIGEPGFGKTTGSKVVLSAYSGLPFSLYESAQMQGHPEQTEEKIIGRPDYAKLATEEVVVWNKTIYLPGIIADEFNRFPAGKHSTLLNSVDTGRFCYLNDVFYMGKKPFFATANNQDDGNAPMMLPMLDRFAFVLEFGYAGALMHEEIRQACSNIRLDLADETLTSEILGMLMDKETCVDKKLEQLKKYSAQFSKRLEKCGIYPFSENEKRQLMQAISNTELTFEASMFLRCINSELNTTVKYGIKRSCDQRDDSNHAKDLASTNTLTGLSPRGLMAIEDMAKGLAFIMGDEMATKDHIGIVAPYAMGHRMLFHQDYIATYENEKRLNGEVQGMDLSRRLLAGIEANYEKMVKELEILHHALKSRDKLTEGQLDKARQMFRDEGMIDHPLAREYVHERKRELRKIKRKRNITDKDKVLLQAAKELGVE